MSAGVRRLARTLAGVEIWPVAALAAAGMLSARALLPALIAAALFWPLRWLAQGRPTRRTPADWPLALLTGLALLSLWVTPLPDVTRPQVARLLLGLALAYALVNWADTRGRLRVAAAGLSAAALALALVAPVSVAWFAEVKLTFIPEALYRALPTLLPDPVHPNVLAGALAILWPLAAAALLFGRAGGSRRERALAWAAALLLPPVVLLAKSRGGLMGLAAAAALLIVLRWWRGWLLLLAAGALAAGVVWQAGPARVVEALAATQAIGGVAGRLEVWSRGLVLVRDFAFSGGGMGAFRPLVDVFNPFVVAGSYADIPHAHNLFLQIAVDLGVGGLIAWLAALTCVTAAAWAAFRRGRAGGDGWLTGLAAGLLASQAALVVHGLTDAVTWGTRPAVLVWAVWGLALSLAAAASQPGGAASDADRSHPAR